MIVAETYFVLLTGQTATWYMEKNISTRHLQHVQPFLGVLNICRNGLTLNLYFTFMHSRFDMTRVCGIYLDLFYQTSQASKSPNTLYDVAAGLGDESRSPETGRWILDGLVGLVKWIHSWMNGQHGETKHFESFLDWWCWGHLQAKSEEIPLLEVDSRVQEICSLWSH